MATGTEARDPRTGLDGRRLRALALRGRDPLVAVALLAIVVALGLRRGGYALADALPVGIGLVAVGLALALLRPAWRFRGGVRVAVAALAGLAAWTALSAAWSPVPDVAVSEAQRTTLYLAALAVGVLAARRDAGLGGPLGAICAGLTAIALLGLLSRLVPDLDLAPLREPAFDLFRLSYPTGYWNAQATASAMSLALLFGLVADRGTRVSVTWLAATAIPAVTVALVLSVSRGGTVAAVLGVATVVVLARRPLQAIVLLVPLALAAAAGILLVVSEPALVDDPASFPGAAEAGPEYVPLLALLGVVAAVVVLLLRDRLAKGEERAARLGRTGRRRRALLREVLVGTAAIAVVVAAIGFSADQRGVFAARSFVETQRESFLGGAAGPGDDLGRLDSLAGNRSELYRVARSTFADHPLVGIGAGGYRVAWLEKRQRDEFVLNAHSLPWEAAAELGIVGFALLMTLAATVLVAVLRNRRRAGQLSRGRNAAVAGALVAVAASCVVDWTWQFAAIVVPAMLLAGIVLSAAWQTAHRPEEPPGRGRRRRRRRRGRSGRRRRAAA
ncbi:O-antigen ligase family protein [Patulibacter brassicae]|uniref:O-antigen ligase family protein n=1 Tax=Patulibacter brassicae TaxID=1705717 RepID=A0ABU4VDZ1_9ACTN|nr:O-antigen ligase family protein [Patulibacter brassicae]MDX8149962.1 O-antigen ligase family protein [Patulibacter brassicae]